jgi:hypothetical protein
MEIIKGNLYKSKNLDLVVMASGQVKGSAFYGQVVIDGDYSKGHFSEMWAIPCFEPYSAEIILKEVIDFSKVQFLEMNDGEIVLARGIDDKNTFAGVKIETGYFNCFDKSEVKRVVTPNFK